MAFALPIAGAHANLTRLGALARTDSPTCAPDERVEAVAGRVKAAAGGGCVVLNDQRVVLGMLWARDLDGHSGQRVAEVMDGAPTTYRPYFTPRTAADFMREHHVGSVLVTNSDGQLLGVVTREAAERASASGSGPRHGGS